MRIKLGTIQRAKDLELLLGMLPITDEDSPIKIVLEPAEADD